jgi:hypothetical protein
MSEKKAKKARKEKPERDWTQERDLRCLPVVHEIFKLIAGLEKMPINHDFMTKEEAYQIYFGLNKQMSLLISDKNIDIKSDMEFIWQCVGEIITIVKKLTTDSIERNESILKDAIFDVKDGEPDLYTATKLAKMIEKKEEIREAVNKIIEA